VTTVLAVDGIAFARNSGDRAEVIARLPEKSRLTVTCPAIQAGGPPWLSVRLGKDWVAEGELDPSRPRLLEPGQSGSGAGHGVDCLRAWLFVFDFAK
jgi:hypothetical protein